MLHVNAKWEGFKVHPMHPSCLDYPPLWLPKDTPPPPA